ncbi:hypothetical protein F4779DRAFT_546074 [Xylariaceae sp. FL0662B]|nr:hypothetical protein F4779DRAFT_546074 [Xylariaceae sp. FL0662B]
MGSKSALVFGASGISGWAFVNEILNDYPSQGTWGRVHALVNRPISRETLLWPDDARLNLVSGIDLLRSTQEELEAVLKNKVPDIDKVTHVYYLAYKSSLDHATEVRDNLTMAKQAITALDVLSPALEFVVLQTGCKHYGNQLLDGRPKDIIYPPLKESMPRLPPPFQEQLFYYAQLDWLTSYAAQKKWGWCETRPDIIIGFVPNQNVHGIATSIGIFLSLFRELHGEGAECPFPGTAKSWVALNNDSSSDICARQAIHVSLTPPWSQRKGEAFNVADSGTPSNWREKWPILCSYFGLKGVKLERDNPIEVRTFIKENMATWEAMEKKYGLRTGQADSPITLPGLELVFLTLFDFDRHYDMTKIYDTGFSEQRDTQRAWGDSFDRMKKAKIIPTRIS